MPIVLIVIGLAIAVGVGSYFLRPEDTVTPPTSEIPTNESGTTEVTEVRDAETVPAETGDDALTGSNVPEEPGDSPTSVPAVSAPEAATPETTTAYNDGTYAINTSYLAPNRANHTVAVSFTLADDIITGANISFGGDDVATSKGYQAKFVAAYESQVIGKKLDDVQLSRVGGASLTTGAFNDALAKVKVAAQN
ncbi:MAG: hypothetical protein MUF19_00120 [Candidatus Pacebacteria bacterium]|jgi:hypothetical protein|nr:hypothetical protein [Candidatus Paceibacterota bacterium]